jgi:hypothetical protein
MPAGVLELDTSGCSRFSIGHRALGWSGRADVGRGSDLRVGGGGLQVPGWPPQYLSEGFGYLDEISRWWGEQR